MKCPVDSRPCHCEEECNLVSHGRQYCSGYDLDPEETAKRDEQGAELGDARRCPVHPNQTTSSPDGLFDNPCPSCEAKQNAEDYRIEKAAHLKGCVACNLWDRNENGALMCCCGPERYAEFHPECSTWSGDPTEQPE